ncbi:MAG TPA: cupredoxin domain-containing protein [Gaiellaceae bacterium]|nr:cupredoxin domain-containing protein [Gaiellaceae bacterium]
MVKNYRLILAALALALAALAAAGCATGEKPSTGSGGTVPAAKAGSIVRASLNSASTNYADLAATPAEVRAGEATALVFTIKDAKNNRVRDLQIVHERPMHLLVVSSDLAEFNHLHPEPQPDGAYKVTHTFPHGGGYKLYADFTPPGENQVVDRFDLAVGGPERPPTPLVADASPTKTVESLTVTLTSDKPLRVGEDLLLNFAVADAQSGRPVTDLQPYLGAMAHFVIINEGATEFIHAHPMGGAEGGAGAHAGMEKASGDGKDGSVRPTVSAHTRFPSAGLYKIWAQFQRAGRVVTVPFVVAVGEADPGAVAAKGEADSTAPAGAIKVTVSGAGFEPEQIKVKPGESVKLAFYRADEKNCASEVVFPSLGIKKQLPVGKTTVVEVVAKDSGELDFGCGMGMLKGALVVTN